MVDQIHATLSKLVVPIEGLVPYGKNPRRGDVDAIAESLTVNGQYKPIVVRAGSNEVLAGNHTLKAARQLGWDKIAVTFVDVDDDGAARIVLVDNRTNDVATYDEAALAELLSSLPDLTGTGFGAADLDEMLGIKPDALNDSDDTPEPPAEPVSVLGDVWVLGKHRVVCGDATDVTAYDALLEGSLADMIWTDPPYNVAVTGGTHDPRDTKNHGKGPSIQNDSMSDGDFRDFLSSSFASMWLHIREGGTIYVCHADSEGINFRCAFQDAGFFLHECLIWVKQNFVFGRSDYHWQHEPILYGWKLGKGHDFYGERNQSTTWEIDRPMRSSMDHPTQKPIALPSKALANNTKPGNLVLDPFGGSGSTLIACHDTGRVARLIELDPRYVDVICRRYQEHTGDKPVLESTGEPHDFTTKD